MQLRQLAYLTIKQFCCRISFELTCDWHQSCSDQVHLIPYQDESSVIVARGIDCLQSEKEMRKVSVLGQSLLP